MPTPADKKREKGQIQRIVLHPDYCPVDKADQLCILIRGQRLTDPVLRSLQEALRKVLVRKGYEVLK